VGFLVSQQKRRKAKALPMATFTVRELESAIRNCGLTSTRAVRRDPWNQSRGFWLVSDLRKVRFRFSFDGSVEIEFHEVIEGFGRPAPRNIASVSSVRQAVQLADLFLGQRRGLDTLPGTDRGEFILGWSQLAEVIESWRASTGAEVEVVREILREDDPRNYEKVIIIRSASRQVLFGEPKAWRDYPVFVNVSEGSIQKVGYLALREDAEQLLDRFLRQHCPLNQAEKLLRQRFEG
jgi:hypothetical protein